MKKAVILLAGLLTVLSMSFASAQFSDVPAGHWAKEAVEALASEGIILGFPDGTFRGNENLTRYQAAMIIYRLLQKLEPGQMASMDEETIIALRNAVQELAAELASLGVRVSALEDNAATKGDVARLEKMIAELQGAAPAANTGDAAAIKDLADRVEAAAIAADTALAQVQDLSGKVDVIGAETAANADSIKALNELSVMLNQDILSLQDRVTALEKATAGGGAVAMPDLSGFATKDDVQAVRDYVTAIRGDLVYMSNKVSVLESNVSDLLDRVGSLERNAFSIGGSLSFKYKQVDFAGAPFDIDRLYSTAFSSGDGNDNGQVVDEADFSSSVIGETSTSLKVTFKTGKFTGTSAGEGVNSYADFFQFTVKGSWTNPSKGDSLNPTLSISSISTTVGIAKDQCLSFTFGRSVKTKFTEYLFDNDKTSYGHGIVAVLKPGFLGTKITAVYGNHDPGSSGDYFYGVHAAIAPFDGFTLGGSYLVQDMAGSPFWGVDASLALGIINLSGEYFLDNAGITSYYVKAGLELGAFTIGANYRNIGAITAASTMSGDADFTNGSRKNSAPFRANSSGYGVNAAADLGIFGLKAYYDNFVYAGTPIQAYGGELSLKLAGMTLAGLYKTHNGAGDSVDGAAPGSFYKAVMGGYLDHPAKDAIIPGLHFYAGYMIYPKSGTNDIEVYADYTGDFSIANVKLIGRYHNTGADTTIKYGIKLETEPLGIFLAPSLKAGYVARTTGAVAETYWFAGLKFNKFFCDHSTFEAAYANYTGGNVADMLLGTKDKAFNAAADYIYTGAGAASGTLSGYYLSWTYWDLQFAYGKFGDGTNSAEAFQIKYAIKF